MNTPNNPFVLPGLGQTGDLAGNPMMAGLEMMQQAWAGMAGSGGFTQAMPVPMNLEDLDRRITELRTVENWLKLNLSMLSSSIQAMEVQRATIATLQSFAGAAPTANANTAADTSASAAQAAQSATQAWWNLMQQQFGQIASAAASTMTATPDAEPTPAPAAKPTSSSTTKKTPTKRSTPAKPAKKSA